MLITKFALVDHVATNKNGDVIADFNQWILGVNDRHIGYVQKSSGIIQLIERVPENLKREIIKRVEEETGFSIADAGMPVQLEEVENDDDELS